MTKKKNLDSGGQEEKIKKFEIDVNKFASGIFIFLKTLIFYLIIVSILVMNDVDLLLALLSSLIPASSYSCVIIGISKKRLPRQGEECEHGSE